MRMYRIVKNIFIQIKMLFLILLLIINVVECQIINRPPHFTPGSGDMARFSLSENTPVGSPVYQLRGVDPEGSALRYSISGPVFSVDRDTGVVRLRQELDRETQDVIEVIISLTDESILGTEPNTISLRREIPVRDYNDNAPLFIGRPYSASLSESTPVGSMVDIMPTIIVTDRDEGKNAEITLLCVTDPVHPDEICDIFSITTEKISNGKYSAIVTLAKPLDFETRSSYILTIQAKDGASVNPLTAVASVAINVLDVQDQPPVFINSPYSATIPENTKEGTSILTIVAMDGDTGNPRPILLTIEHDIMEHFRLESIGNPHDGRSILYTTNNPLDREYPDILQNGGVYTFSIKATELINDELPADFTITQVTIVLTDVDDHNPKFNKKLFEVSIPENLEQDTPLPGLSIFVIDEDLGANSRYNLSLRNVQNAEGVFAVSPSYGEGRTPIVVKIVNSDNLDYDVEDETKRTLEFDIIASVRGLELASSRIIVHLQDANDNSPLFNQSSYYLKVEENSKIGTKISHIIATDKDTGEFGKLRYVLKGFGSEYFYTDSEKGGVFVKKNLNYENQKSYSLTLVALDGGGREANANLFIDVLDVNDNYPIFESLEYTRTIREGATEFEPQFYVRATDVDGPTQGGGQITYSIESENSISGHVFQVNPITGEIKIAGVASSMDTERGQYELIVTATDHGIPPLKNETRVLIRVGISGNQRPIFKGHYSSYNGNSLPGPPSYRVSIPENAAPGYNVTTVSATDPDGLDSLLTYRIVGASDNFVIDDRTGLLKVSTDARLDRDTNADSYSVVVNAVDAGFPIPETATTTVFIKIQDVNDKPPKFTQPNYITYVSERSEIDTEVLTIKATDTDLDAKLEYSIIEPIKAASKTGAQLTSTNLYNYKSAFKIDNESGVISVNGSLDYNLAAVIFLTIEARDLKAEYNKEKQFATADVTLYVQSFKETNPIFKNKGWNSAQAVINKNVKEEIPIGSTVFTLIAEDPVSGESIMNFELIQPDSFGLFGLNDRTGEIILKKRLDYEGLNETKIDFIVKANSNDLTRKTIANINITIENVNDNDPIFEKKLYRGTILETAKYPEKILNVHAKDNDAVLNDRDHKLGYNIISYSLSGENAPLFHIDNKTGDLQIAENQTLDREKQSVIRLLVTAEDSPGKPSDSRRTTAQIVIEVLDVNDNPPIFSGKSYTAVIPENSPIDTSVINITATDPDEGPGGEVRYDLLNEGEANGLLKINPLNGEIRTKIPLTGKGRSEPYDLIIRAQDNGGQIPKQESLYSDVALKLYIGDVSANDGIPFFIAPKIGQIANVTEDATIGSPVFQVIASDPDSPASPSGMLKFRIQDDIVDAKAFRIDPKTGLITTMIQLDRETKSSYNIILEVADNGEPPQAATRVLRINILDIDDHKPRFIRDVDAQPFEMPILEELPKGTIVGNLSAIDEDIDDNGAIDYMFIDGNELDLFNIKRTASNGAIITTTQKLDREKAETYLLTVKCFKYKSLGLLGTRKSYNKLDYSEIQILVRVIDIDDHLPEFEPKDQAIGVRLNIPIDMSIITVKATDADPDALPIIYSMENITFVPQFFRKDNNISEKYSGIFVLNNITGEIRTTKSLSDFVDGFFQITIRANNSKDSRRFTDHIVKIYIIRDKSLLRFVFSRPASEMQNIVDQFTKKVQTELIASDLELQVFDAQVLTKQDHSLDFTSTSSCFQLSRHGSALSPVEMQKIMDSNDVRNALGDIYSQYSVSRVDGCSVSRKVATATLMYSPGTWLVVLAAIIGIAALIATCSACCLSRRYKKQIRRLTMPRMQPQEVQYATSGTVLYTEPIYGPL